MMRFNGHDPSSPIHQSEKHDHISSAPDLDPVTTTLADCLILRIGAFDDDDINVDNTGLVDHTTITMDESSSSGGTCSGGAGYQQQATPGPTDFTDFNLTASEEFITLTVAIAPFVGGSGSVSGGAGYVKQTSSGSSGTSTFALTATEEARMVTVAVAQDSSSSLGALAISKLTPYEFDTSRGETPALAQIDSTHTLCAYAGNGDDGWATVLIVDTGTWNITQGTSFEFDTVKGKTPALVQIDSTHYLCAYAGDSDDGWAVVLTVNTSSWTISAGTAHEFDTVKGKTPALTQIDSAHYLCVYAGDGDDGWVVTLAVDSSNWTVTSAGAFEFDTVMGKNPALEMIDSTHHLCVYESNSNTGWSVVLIPNIPPVLP